MIPPLPGHGVSASWEAEVFSGLWPSGSRCCWDGLSASGPQSSCLSPPGLLVFSLTIHTVKGMDTYLSPEKCFVSVGKHWLLACLRGEARSQRERKRHARGSASWEAAPALADSVGLCLPVSPHHFSLSLAPAHCGRHPQGHGPGFPFEAVSPFSPPK